MVGSTGGQSRYRAHIRTLMPDHHDQQLDARTLVEFSFSRGTALGGTMNDVGQY